MTGWSIPHHWMLHSAAIAGVMAHNFEYYNQYIKRKMADQCVERMLIVNDLLCFLLRRFKVTEHVVLQGLLSAYYSLSDISVAKKELLKYISNTIFDRPFLRYPDRHDLGRSDKEISNYLVRLSAVNQRCGRKVPPHVEFNARESCERNTALLGR